jgi:hypothetical protein
MDTQKRDIKIPVIGYQLIMKNMDAKNVKAIIRYIDQNGPGTLDEKTGYLVDIVNYLEEMGVDRYEMVDALEIMKENEHDTAHFGMMGTFIYSEFTGVKQ